MTAAMSLLGWSQDGEKFHLVPLASNRFLKMISELAVGWLLLDGAVLAEKAAAKLSPTDPDRAFYEGRKYSALWYGRNVLPEIETSAKVLAIEDATPVEVPDAAFATL